MLQPVVGVIGGESLLGQEACRRIAEELPLARVEALGADSNGPTLEMLGSEEVSIEPPLDVDTLSELDAAVLAGPPDSGRTAFNLISMLRPRPHLVDLGGGLEDHHEARLRSPLVEPPGFAVPPSAIHVVAHPAASALAYFLGRLSAIAPLRGAVVHIYEPASEHGMRGITELQQQTVALLSLKSMPTDVFDTQVAFSMLPAFGASCAPPLVDVEALIERHLATLLSFTPHVPMPSLRLVHAPVFHNYTFSIWVEFEEKQDSAAVAARLSGELLSVEGPGDEPLNNMNVSGRPGIVVLPFTPDRNNLRAAWFWMAADNLRIRADGAAALLVHLVATERGDGEEAE